MLKLLEVMKISILTMFPQLIDSLFENQVVKRALNQGFVEIEVVDIKDFAEGSFRHIDDSPYGGKSGMIIRPDVLSNALKSVKTDKSHSVLLSPKGKLFNQKKAREFSTLEHIVLICGHYEGTDSRFDSEVDELVSVGDFVLSGGEIPACLISDSVIRLLSGVLKDGVTQNESHESFLLEQPQYTHPLEFKGQTVPEVLLSGNTKKIDEWRHMMAIEETKKYRPDLAKQYMVKNVALAEESLTNLFSEKLVVSDNIVRFKDDKLRDMYDHNMFVCSACPTKEEIEKCIEYQKARGDNFLKLESPVKWPDDLTKKFGMEAWEEITMTISSEKSKDWVTNPNVVIKDVHSSKVGKDIIEIENLNYGSVYGEDFVMRKMHRYLTEAEKKKKLNFLVAYLNNEPAGYLYTWNDFDCVGIDGLIVSEKFRHKGVATTLLKEASAFAPFTYLHAAVDDTPKDMYKALGFEPISSKFCYFVSLGVVSF